MSTTHANKLVVSLPSDREILLVREFDAPQELLFKVFTSQEHVARWFAPPFVTLLRCELDARVGGRYRYDFKGEEGPQMTFSGEVLELVPCSRFVYTESFSIQGAGPQHPEPSVVTVEFEDIGGRTRMRCLSRYDSKATRDAVVESGMEHGAAISYDQAEAVAQSLMA